ncbi:hypothetical protein BJ684DRAFT_11704 [Piptocephalis cylindrospora]|uniref:DNA topoisomerase I n=1 Tax=Piptocephalis cylindrospora TaxID=1907219 RepID=A0A4P9Y0N4_9FUNG|nr:hypothetical protein BJ684DRAFT_11704 [Piptocephalis cylindrospora]|eukprot:RKP12298.1 hypothetical protein BJ684DRAFT_11704 [Piptocephalis cylindrospora]
MDEEGEDDDDEHKWWLENRWDDSVKWKTLSHAGVLFPPPYIPLPKGIRMKYDGVPVSLPPEAEEVMGFFAALLGTDYEADEVFVQNFFTDFLSILARYPPTNPVIRSFALCDFRPVFDHFQMVKDQKKALTKEDKERAKEEKAKLEEKYGWAYLDGRKEKVGNFRIEPPGLFRGRGKHPKTGMLKRRVLPEQVTLNIGKGTPIPPPPKGHKWGNIKHDQTVTWLATWNENINGSTKYVFLGATSSLKGISDLKKFEKARELKGHVHRIRKNYTRDLKDRLMAVRQRSTALYLIDQLALRAGNEKGDEEADTVGCCSLRCEHIRLEPEGNRVIFDFLGKDSIRYHNEVEVTHQVWKNLRHFLRGKSPSDDVFDQLRTASLNKHLTSLMPGLTAKVFRTFNASHTMEAQLRLLTNSAAPVSDKVLAYNRANREVAILCNHQRSVTKNHGAQMDRLGDKLKSVKYQRWRVKRKLLNVDPKLSKKRPELKEPESDLEPEWCEKHEMDLVEKEKEKLRKKFDRENEKALADGKKKLSEKELKVWFKEAEVVGKTYAKERKSGKVLAGARDTQDRLEAALAKLDERISVMKNDAIDKEENKTTALGTSKLNYIDPRITSAWCKREGVPLEKMFNKTLREKFKWAMDTEGDWEF